MRYQPAVFLASLLGALIFQPVFSNPMQKTIINGVVSNFEDPNELPAIELINFMPFISEWNTYSCFIEQDGAFRFEFELLYPDCIRLTFRDVFTVYAHPGDSIYLSIDAAMLSDTSKIETDEHKYIRISSPRQSFQDNYQVFTRTFFAAFQTYDCFLAQQEAQTELDHVAYMAYLKEQSDRYAAFLEDYCKSHQPGSEFKEWASNWLYLKKMNESLRYTWLHPMYNELDRNTFRLPDGYYDFLLDQRHNDEVLMSSREYRSFLHELYMHLYLEFHQSDLGSESARLFKAGDKIEAYRLNLNYIVDNSEGFEREYFVSRLYSRLIYWKFFEEFEALYDTSLVGRDDFTKILNKEYADLQQLLEKPVFAKNLTLHQADSSMVELVFNTLPERFPGKVLYVDFWAPWCGPCMGEMPRSKELQEKMKGKEIVFVFLAGRCTEKSWKATISQKQLSGEHFLLADREYSMLADTFNIAGIPRYMIIDQEGRVVNDHAPRPGDDSLVDLLDALCK